MTITELKKQHEKAIGKDSLYNFFRPQALKWLGRIKNLEVSDFGRLWWRVTLKKPTPHCQSYEAYFSKETFQVKR